MYNRQKKRDRLISNTTVFILQSYEYSSKSIYSKLIISVLINEVNRESVSDDIYSPSATIISARLFHHLFVL